MKKFLSMLFKMLAGANIPAPEEPELQDYYKNF